MVNMKKYEERIEVFLQKVQESLRRIRPDYTITDFLGEGSFGIVYEIKNKQHDTLCLKVLATPGIEKTKVHRAVKALGVAGILEREKYPLQLQHPNIVDVVEGIQIEMDGVEIPCVVQKKIDGPTLERYVSEFDPSGREQFARIAQGIASGVGYAHQNGIAHRDLKLDNIKLTADNTACIFDFSIAEFVDSEGRILNQRPAEPSQKHSAPEVQANDDLLDAKRADVWSLGLIFQELLVGKRTEASTERREIPKRYRAIIHRCLEKNPNKRYKDGNAVARALQHAEWYYAKRVGAVLAVPVLSIAAIAIPLGLDLLNQNMSTFYTNKCVYALEANNSQEAADFCQEAISWNERNCTAHTTYADSLIEQNKTNDAEKAYRSAIRFCGKDDYRSSNPSVMEEIRKQKLLLEDKGKVEEATALETIYKRIDAERKKK